jgi:hypothetical protein
MRTRRLPRGHAERGTERVVWSAVDSRRGVAGVGFVERNGAQTDHRRFPEAARRLVRPRLAQAAHLAVDTSGVGLRLRARWRHIGCRRVAADFSALHLTAGQDPGRSSDAAGSSVRRGAPASDAADVEPEGSRRSAERRVVCHHLRQWPEAVTPDQGGGEVDGVQRAERDRHRFGCSAENWGT